VFVATSAKYPLQSQRETKGGVDLPKGVGVAKSSVLENGEGNGVYRLDENVESAADSTELVGYRQDKVDEKIWENIEAVWKRALEKALQSMHLACLGSHCFHLILAPLADLLMPYTQTALQI